MTQMTDAYETYQQHQLQYDYVQQRLTNLRERILETNESTRRTLLWLADTYALITSNTNVEAHDLAFAGIARKPFDLDHVADVLKPAQTRARASGNHTVMYYNMKAEYIRHNLANVDYGQQSDLFQNGEFDELHRVKVDTVKGLAETKAAFSLAMSGVLEKACLDSNMLTEVGIDSDYEYNTVEDYDNAVSQAREQTPQLSSETPPFIWQWVVWDHVRGSTVTTHDAWFLAADAHCRRQTDFQPTETTLTKIEA